MSHLFIYDGYKKKNTNYQYATSLQSYAASIFVLFNPLNLEQITIANWESLVHYQIAKNQRR